MSAQPFTHDRALRRLQPLAVLIHSDAVRSNDAKPPSTVIPESVAPVKHCVVPSTARITNLDATKVTTGTHRVMVTFGRHGGVPNFTELCCCGLQKS